VTAFAQAVLTLLWLAGLWTGAPLLRGGTRGADRLRDTIVLGTAIPLFLALLHLFYWPACWIVLVGCVVAARTRHAAAKAYHSHLRPEPPERPPYLLFAALALVAWPAFVHPALGADTLSHHATNIVAWAHAHSLWTTHAPSWWYPPGSAFFASGLYAGSARFVPAWTGIAPLALLGMRIFAWAREGAQLPVRLADVLAAATICILPFALEAGSLQDDVWLAAFFVEILWSAPVDDVTVLRSAAMCALIEPAGWIFAGVALAASRARPRAWIAAGCAVAFWIVRDSVLLRHVFIAPVTGTVPIPWHTFVAFASVAPFGFLLALFALASPWTARDLPLRLAGLATVVVATAMGAAVSYFDPAVATGALVLAPYALRYAPLALVLLLIALFGEMLRIVIAYAHYPATLYAIPIAILVPVLIAYLRGIRPSAAVPAAR
jgi:hypothetical protein